MIRLVKFENQNEYQISIKNKYIKNNIYIYIYMQNPIEYIPTVHMVDKSKDDILKYNENPEFSTNTTYPQFSLGFQHYIHQTKNKMEKIIPQFEDKKSILHC